MKEHCSVRNNIKVNGIQKQENETWPDMEQKFRDFLCGYFNITNIRVLITCDLL